MLYCKRGIILITHAGKGIDHEMLGAQPGLTYQVMGGGRFFPSVSRKVGPCSQPASNTVGIANINCREIELFIIFQLLQKVAETMKGVEILIAMIPTQPHFFDQIHGRKFYSSLIEDNLMDKCSMVVARIVDNYEASGHGDKPDTDPMTIMEKQNIDLTKFKEKLRKYALPILILTGYRSYRETHRLEKFIMSTIMISTQCS